MKNIKFIAICGVALCALILLPLLAGAQENEPVVSDEETITEASESAEAADGVYTKPRQTEEIQRLRKLYQDQVEKYTDQEREYRITKLQWQKLNTLQSLEEAIKSTREVMITRTEVLITYYELMRASLADTEGVELTEKQKNIDLMVAYIEALREHREDLLQTTDREQIAERVTEFAELSKEFESTAYKALALIRVGDIQTVYDKSLIIYEDVLKYHDENPTNPLKQAERDRAYREVNNAITKTRGDLLKIRTSYAENKNFSRSSFASTLGKDLNTAYSGTSQILFFLEELFVELT